MPPYSTRSAILDLALQFSVSVVLRIANKQDVQLPWFHVLSQVLVTKGRRNSKRKEQVFTFRI